MLMCIVILSCQVWLRILFLVSFSETWLISIDIHNIDKTWEAREKKRQKDWFWLEYNLMYSIRSSRGITFNQAFHILLKPIWYYCSCSSNLHICTTQVGVFLCLS